MVDPGVGGTRPPIILEADGRWYVGPGNGLFELVNNRDKNFTRAKMERRMAQIEESVARYLEQLDTADRQEPSGGSSWFAAPLMEAGRNVEVMWLLCRLVPDHKTIADFRKDNGAAIRKVCAHFIALCRAMGLLTQASVAIDGSKFKAVERRTSGAREPRSDSAAADRSIPNQPPELPVRLRQQPINKAAVPWWMVGAGSVERE